MNQYPEIMELDGVYFRVCREGEWKSISFTDLTADEQSDVLSKMSQLELRRMVVILARAVRDLGEAFEIVEMALDG